MIKDITLGSYIETGSILHKLDPRVKILMYLLYLVSIFIGKSFYSILVAFLITVILSIVARFSIKDIWSTVKPTLPLAIFIFVMNLFSIRTGEVIWEFKFLKITNEGLLSASLMGARLILLILSTGILLTLTTTPLKIADGLESLGAPFKLIGVPVHEISMMMSIALRFIPTLLEETDKIMKAQMSRGADYDSGSIINRVRGYVTVLVPLFVSSFKRADDLSVAMDARCYRGGKGRTKLNPLKLTPKDVLAGFVMLIGAGLIIVANYI